MVPSGERATPGANWICPGDHGDTAYKLNLASDYLHARPDSALVLSGDTTTWKCSVRESRAPPGSLTSFPREAASHRVARQQEGESSGHYLGASPILPPATPTIWTAIVVSPSPLYQLIPKSAGPSLEETCRVDWRIRLDLNKKGTIRCRSPRFPFWVKGGLAELEARVIGNKPREELGLRGFDREAG